MGSRRRRSSLSSLLVLLTLTGGMLVATAPGVGSSERATTRVRVTVKYKSDSGKNRALPGVEVFLFDGGVARHACTSARGIATFTEVTPGGGHLSATGVSVDVDNLCDNAEFTNPENGRKMLSVFYNDHHGVQTFDSFDVAEGSTKRIRYDVTTPARFQQKRICFGLWATKWGNNGSNRLVGTNGPDIIQGNGGHDRILGRGGDDILCGGGGVDRIEGGGGDDLLFGESGSDKPKFTHILRPTRGKGGLYGDLGNDTAFGGSGTDKCRSETKAGCEK